MGTQRVYRSVDLRRRIPSRYRASHRRLQRIRWRDDWPVHMWVVVIALIVLAFLAPRLAELHYALHYPKAHQQ